MTQPTAPTPGQAAQPHPRNAKMDALSKAMHGNPAFQLKNVAAAFPPTAPTPGQATHDKELAELRKLLVPIRSPRPTPKTTHAFGGWPLIATIFEGPR